jgi:hypothetical protein
VANRGLDADLGGYARDRQRIDLGATEREL